MGLRSSLGASDPGQVRMLLLVMTLAAGCGRIGFDGALSVEEAVGKLSVGHDHACAVVDEAVWCWGRNQARQLGDGTLESRPRPVRALSFVRAAAVAAGYAHTCAISVVQPATATVAAAGGKIWCWGNNEDLQLGLALGSGVAPISDGEDPVIVPGLPDEAVELVAGWSHTCARFVDRSVWCWGKNTVGQLGRGTTDPDGQLAQRVDGLGDVVQLAARGDATCARERSGTVHCWGGNDSFQLGDGTNVDRSTPTPVVNVAARWITMGVYHACAVTTAGQYTCWGDNSAGELGDGTTNDRMVATTASLGEDYTSIAAGEDYSCAVRTSGGVACWGYNGSGTLADGTTEGRPTPAVALGLDDIRAISASVHHACALRADGVVLCWGDGPLGELGNGEASVATPLRIPGLVATQVATGRSHACAVSGSQIKCWGAGQDGQLGDGAQVSRASPVTVAGLSASPRQLALGSYHSCAVLADDTAWCWGYGGYGQLGNGDTLSVEAPVEVIGLAGVSSIAAGAKFTCAIQLDGTVWCWGHNGDGQLGDGMTTDSPTPVQVMGVVGAVEIAAGLYHACARTAASEVYCWGDNPEGQLGIGTTVDSVATLVPGLIASAIGAGGDHSCAIDPSAALWCWGDNSQGQLGVWGPDFLSPTNSNVGSVQLIALGVAGTTVITAANSQSWGSNPHGELADGTYFGHSEPMASLWPTTVSSIAMGEHFTCAATTNSEVLCAGENQEGQIGQGTTTRALTPVVVPIP